MSFPIRNRIRLLIIVVVMGIFSSSCGAAAAPVGQVTVRLTGQVVISVARNKAVQMAITRGVNAARANAVGNAARVVGTFAFDQVAEAIFADEEAWYITIHHWIDDEPATTVVEIKNDTTLGIKIKGEADIYPFTAERRFLFDALPYEETEITVFNRDTDFDSSAEGTISLPSFNTAFDLESGASLQVSDPEFLPQGADLLFVQSERYGQLINGAEAISRHGITPTPELCKTLQDSAWRTNLVAANTPELAEAWCVRTAEGAYGSIWVEEQNLAYQIWVEEE